MNIWGFPELLRQKEPQLRLRLCPSSSCLASILIILAVLISSLRTNATRNAYNAYNYDRPICFSPDGRILQVEYASLAGSLSPPMVIVEHGPSDALGNDGGAASSCLVVVCVRNKCNSPQNRIVISEDGKHCCVMSGILSDCLRLLQEGIEATIRQRIKNRKFEISAFAQAIADECLSRTSSGHRPYGSTMIVCGFESKNTIYNEVEGKLIQLNQPSIYQIDPSGGIFLHRKSRDNRERSQVRCIVGGTQSLQQRLKERINQEINELGKLDDIKDSHISTEIARVAKVLIEENPDNRGSKPIELEVVVISSELGCHRFDKNQIEYVQNLLT